MNRVRNHFRDVLFGVAVGDALGVPYEFRSRAQLRQNPATDMTGYGTYNLPPGTWSDDSSLTFCLAEALTHDKFDLRALAGLFENWLFHNHWTPRGEVFDVGITTRNAISRYSDHLKPELAGSWSESSNGNGSLMRILPLVFYVQHLPINDRYEMTSKVSSMTHGHVRSVISCFYYLEFARLLLRGMDKHEIYHDLQATVLPYLDQRQINKKEQAIFDRLFRKRIYDLDEAEISGSGYVVHALEASVWSLLTTENYRDAILKAVNLGEDTDTTAAITGGLAGLLYGCETIPENWMNQLARKNDIAELAARLGDRFSKSAK